MRYDEETMALLGLKPDEVSPDKVAATRAATDAKYPQTTAMMNSRKTAEEILNFLTHCAKQGVALYRQAGLDDEALVRLDADDVTPLLDSFFGIDRDALKTEKRQMIRDLRDLLEGMNLDEATKLVLAERLDQHEARMP